MKEFRPEIGLKTSDCYLHGINDLDDILCDGVIEFVGRDYFILRNTSKDKPLFVSNDQYWCIEEYDFN